MFKIKSQINRIYRLMDSYTWRSENEARFLLIIMNASWTKSKGLGGKALNQFMEQSLEKMCLDTKEYLHKYLIKIKDNFTNNELLSNN